MYSLVKIRSKLLDVYIRNNTIDGYVIEMFCIEEN